MAPVVNLPFSALSVFPGTAGAARSRVSAAGVGKPGGESFICLHNSLTVCGFLPPFGSLYFCGRLSSIGLLTFHGCLFRCGSLPDYGFLKNCGSLHLAPQAFLQQPPIRPHTLLTLDHFPGQFFPVLGDS
jgi:hypothetical protein